MKRNVGKVDRILRIIIGLGAIGYALKAPETMPYRELGWIGVIPLLTALAGVCPLYALLGMRTCKLETQEAVQARQDEAAAKAQEAANAQDADSGSEAGGENDDDGDDDTQKKA